MQTEPEPIYVLAGADPYLVRQGRAAVRTHVFGDADPGMALVELDGADAQLAEVLDTLRTLPMLAPHRLVCVREAYKFVNLARDALEKYLASPSPTGSLCLEVEKWNAETKLGKRVADIGLVVQCEADRPRQIPSWLQHQAKGTTAKRSLSPPPKCFVSISAPTWARSSLHSKCWTCTPERLPGSTPTTSTC